jgi:hypothetical protein
MRKRGAQVATTQMGRMGAEDPSKGSVRASQPLRKVTACSHAALRGARQARFQTLIRAEIQKGRAVKMNGFRKTVAAATIAGSMLVGGVVGAALYGVSAVTAAAATATPSPTTPAATAPDPNAPFVSNETAAHEATESAAREAQENAGIRPTVP